MWSDFTNLKAVLEQRDATINELYSRVTTLEDAAVIAQAQAEAAAATEAAQRSRPPLTSISHPVSGMGF